MKLCIVIIVIAFCSAKKPKQNKKVKEPGDVYAYGDYYGYEDSSAQQDEEYGDYSYYYAGEYIKNSREATEGSGMEEGSGGESGSGSGDGGKWNEQGCLRPKWAHGQPGIVRVNYSEPILPTKKYPVGARVSMTCQDTEFRLRVTEGEDSSSTCLTSELWSGALQCEDLTGKHTAGGCMNPQTNTRTELTFSEKMTTFGNYLTATTVEITCATGYGTKSNEYSAICDKEADAWFWSIEDMQCYELKCDLEFHVAGGHSCYPTNETAISPSNNKMGSQVKLCCGPRITHTEDQADALQATTTTPRATTTKSRTKLTKEERPLIKNINKLLKLSALERKSLKDFVKTQTKKASKILLENMKKFAKKGKNTGNDQNFKALFKNMKKEAAMKSEKGKKGSKEKSNKGNRNRQEMADIVTINHPDVRIKLGKCSPSGLNKVEWLFDDGRIPADVCSSH